MPLYLSSSNFFFHLHSIVMEFQTGEKIKIFFSSTRLDSFFFSRFYRNRDQMPWQLHYEIATHVVTLGNVISGLYPGGFVANEQQNCLFLLRHDRINILHIYSIYIYMYRFEILRKSFLHVATVSNFEFGHHRIISGFNLVSLLRFVFESIPPF